MSKNQTRPEPRSVEGLPVPPDGLAYGDVRLLFDQLVPAKPLEGLAQYYHFHILTAEGTRVGHINFRVGDTEHVRLYAGHIGFQILEAFRGRRFALQACHAIAPFVRSIYEAVSITCDPDNEASRRTIERLGAAFIDEMVVPPEDPSFRSGSRRKRRYCWRIQAPEATNSNRGIHC